MKQCFVVPLRKHVSGFKAAPLGLEGVRAKTLTYHEE
jgi:hypothetical protein